MTGTSIVMDGDSSGATMETMPALDPRRPEQLDDLSFSTAGVIRDVEGGPDLEAMFDVPVKVQAVLGRARMPIGDLLQLTAGTVIELDRRVGEPIDIFINNRLIARGEVVIIDNSLGVTLTEIVREEQ